MVFPIARTNGKHLSGRAFTYLMGDRDKLPVPLVLLTL